MKVCRLEADVIRRDIRNDINDHGRVLKETVVKSKDRAIWDAKIHALCDPYFICGYGPAVVNGRVVEMDYLQ